MLVKLLQTLFTIQAPLPIFQNINAKFLIVEQNEDFGHHHLKFSFAKGKLKETVGDKAMSFSVDE